MSAALCQSAVVPLSGWGVFRAESVEVPTHPSFRARYPRGIGTRTACQLEQPTGGRWGGEGEARKEPRSVEAANGETRIEASALMGSIHKTAVSGSLLTEVWER